MSVTATPSAPPMQEARHLNIQVVQLKKSSLVIRAINHPLRQQMLQLLYSNGQLTVTELYHHFGLEQSVASQHLALLRRAGFVDTAREGKYIHYSVNEQRLEQVHRFCSDLLLQPFSR